ncbi:MAG: hypothetical protein J5527_11830 [Treponema sp.]|nr:hypothetical protein [Treponema sp.]
MEKVTDLTEKKIDGYFDTIKTVFFTQLETESLLFNSSGQAILKLDSNTYNTYKNTFTDFEKFDKYFHQGDGTVRNNFHDSIISNIIINSWVIFELIIKDLTSKDYSEKQNDISMDYKSNKFGFSKDEKSDLDLFYYIRNSFVHYNGAYHKYKKIKHTYEGQLFSSENHEGEQIEINNLIIAYKMHLDMQKMAKKAWTNVEKLKKGGKA